MKQLHDDSKFCVNSVDLFKLAIHKLCFNQNKMQRLLQLGIELRISYAFYSVKMLSHTLTPAHLPSDLVCGL